MSVTTNIVATYCGPARVVDRLLVMGPREDRALAFVMAFCVIGFIAQLPGLARRAHLEGSDLDMLMGGSLLGSVFILPLLFYFIAWISHLVARAFGGKGTSYGARLALFWALLASAPLVLLNGLVAGIMGPGVAQTSIGWMWLATFVWFWLSGLRQTHRATE